MAQLSRHKAKQRRHWRIRKHVVGTAERPRLSVCFTSRHIYVQLVDDQAGRTLAAASTLDEQMSNGGKPPKNTVATAKTIGALAAKRAVEKKISQVVFDRGGLRYHGKVKALADGAREAGLKF